MDLSVAPIADQRLVRAVVTPAQRAALRPGHPLQQCLVVGEAKYKYQFKKQRKAKVVLGWVSLPVKRASELNTERCNNRRCVARLLCERGTSGWSSTFRPSPL